MERIPASKLIDVIVKELLTDEDKEALKIIVGKATRTIEEDLIYFYGHQWVASEGTFEDAKIEAIHRIYENQFLIERLKNKDFDEKELNPRTQFINALAWLFTTGKI